MITLVDPNDSRAVRNKDNVLALYDLMINRKRSEEATAKLAVPAYIQHNPLIADGSEALGKYFGQVTRERAKARVVVHRIIASGDYVWAHVNLRGSLESTSTEWMPTAKPSSTGTYCNLSAIRKTRPPGSRRICPAPIQMECSEKELGDEERPQI